MLTPGVHSLTGCLRMQMHLPVCLVLQSMYMCAGDAVMVLRCCLLISAGAGPAFTIPSSSAAEPAAFICGILQCLVLVWPLYLRLASAEASSAIGSQSQCTCLQLFVFCCCLVWLLMPADYSLPGFSHIYTAILSNWRCELLSNCNSYPT